MDNFCVATTKRYRNKAVRYYCIAKKKVVRHFQPLHTLSHTHTYIIYKIIIICKPFFSNASFHDRLYYTLYYTIYSVNRVRKHFLYEYVRAAVKWPKNNVTRPEAQRSRYTRDDDINIILN